MIISGTNARVFFNQQKSSSYWSVRNLYWKNNCFTWLAHLGLLPLRFSSLSLTESAINKETTTTKWKAKRIRRQEGKSRKSATTTNVCSEVKWSGLQNYKKATAGGGSTKVLISLHGWKSKLSGVIQGVATYIPAVSFIHKNCTYSTSDSNWCLAAVWQHLGRHTHLHIHTYAHMCIDFSNHYVCVRVFVFRKWPGKLFKWFFIYDYKRLTLCCSPCCSILIFGVKINRFYRVGAPTTPSLTLLRTHITSCHKKMSTSSHIQGASPPQTHVQREAPAMQTTKITTRTSETCQKKANKKKEKYINVA